MNEWEGWGLGGGEGTDIETIAGVVSFDSHECLYFFLFDEVKY